MGEWRDCGRVEEFVDRTPVRVMLDGGAILVLRANGDVFAIGNQCTHQGAMLDKGVVKIMGSLPTVTCPAHGSLFRLDDGRVLRGPATKPVPAYEVKVEDGRVFARLRE
jgi:nitrite reductase/ring-hydroxylating ferredoxin subunit